jgi:hypothetical protein
VTATREVVLARYDPIRASTKRVLKLAEEGCAKADWTRATKHVAPWAEPAALAEASAPEMLTDIALFEPNQRGRRIFDRFLSEKASQRLGAPDFALAQRIAGAVFSIFGFAAARRGRDRDDGSAARPRRARGARAGTEAPTEEGRVALERVQANRVRLACCPARGILASRARPSR